MIWTKDGVITPSHLRSGSSQTLSDPEGVQIRRVQIRRGPDPEGLQIRWVQIPDGSRSGGSPDLGVAGIGGGQIQMGPDPDGSEPSQILTDPETS